MFLRPSLKRRYPSHALKETLKKAGYTLDAADITVAGTLAKDDKGWAIVAQPSGQHLALEGPNVDQALGGASVGASIEITGYWKTLGTGTTSHEAISPARKASAAGSQNYRRHSFPNFAKVSFIQPSFGEPAYPAVTLPAAIPAAPIRVTSPGLTVYKGGAVTPRLYFIKQHLGNLGVNRQVFDLSVL